MLITKCRAIPLNRIINVTFLPVTHELVLAYEDGPRHGAELRLTGAEAEAWWEYFQSLNAIKVSIEEKTEEKEDSNPEAARLARVVRGAVGSTGGSIESLNAQHLKSIKELAELEAAGLIKFVGEAPKPEDIPTPAPVKEDKKSGDKDQLEAAVAKQASAKTTGRVTVKTK